MEISNELRNYVRVQDKKLSVHIAQELTHVWKRLTGKRTLDTSCSSCVSTAVKIVRNYIDYHEPTKHYEMEEEKELTTSTSEVLTVEQLEKMKLSELRKLDASIKSTSAQGWIAQYIAKHGI